MSESLGEQIRRVLQDAPFAMRQLAADSGLSYDVLRSWRSGRRRPSRSSAARLAAGLQRRGELLLRLSAELRETAQAGGDGSGRPREGGATAGVAPARQREPEPGSMGGGMRRPEPGGPEHRPQRTGMLGEPGRQEAEPRSSESAGTEQAGATGEWRASQSE